MRGHDKLCCAWWAVHEMFLLEPNRESWIDITKVLTFWGITTQGTHRRYPFSPWKREEQ